MSKKTELTRRKVLGGLAGIGVASAAAGAGTMAYFNDTEKSAGNTVSAGTLELNLSGDDTDEQMFSVSKAKPGDQATGTNAPSSLIKNTGTLAGSVDVNIGDATGVENGTPEAETETSSGSELPTVLEARVLVDDDGDPSTTSDQTVVAGWDTLENIDSTDYDVNHSLSSGGTTNLVVEWRIPTGAGNEIQDDDVSVGITVELNQKTTAQ